MDETTDIQVIEQISFLFSNVIEDLAEWYIQVSEMLYYVMSPLPCQVLNSAPPSLEEEVPL